MSKRKKHRLKNLIIKELSLVDRPANGGARVAVWKRAPVEATAEAAAEAVVETGAGPDAATTAPTPDLGALIRDHAALKQSIEAALSRTDPAVPHETLAGMLDRYVEAVQAMLGVLSEGGGTEPHPDTEMEALADVVARLLADLRRFEDENKALKDKLAETSGTAEADPAVAEVEKMLAKADLPAPVRALVSDLAKRADYAAAELAKADDARLTAAFVAKAADYDALSVSPEDFGPVLKRLATGRATYRDMLELQRVLSAANRAARFALTEKGSTTVEAGDAEAVLNDLATKRATEKKISFARAYAEIINERPDLYQQALDQRAA